VWSLRFEFRIWSSSNLEFAVCIEPDDVPMSLGLGGAREFRNLNPPTPFLLPARTSGKRKGENSGETMLGAI
jgi:hypothetical protein